MDQNSAIRDIKLRLAPRAPQASAIPGGRALPGRTTGTDADVTRAHGQPQRRRERQPRARAAARRDPSPANPREFAGNLVPISSRRDGNRTALAIIRVTAGGSTASAPRSDAESRRFLQGGCIAAPNPDPGPTTPPPPPTYTQDQGPLAFLVALSNRADNGPCEPARGIRRRHPSQLKCGAVTASVSVRLCRFGLGAP